MCCGASFARPVRRRTHRARAGTRDHLTGLRGHDGSGVAPSPGRRRVDLNQPAAANGGGYVRAWTAHLLARGVPRRGRRGRCRGSQLRNRGVRKGWPRCTGCTGCAGCARCQVFRVRRVHRVQVRRVPPGAQGAGAPGAQAAARWFVAGPNRFLLSGEFPSGADTVCISGALDDGRGVVYVRHVE